MKSEEIISVEATSWCKRLLPDEKEAGMNKAVRKRWEKIKAARDERVLQALKAAEAKAHNRSPWFEGAPFLLDESWKYRIEERGSAPRKRQERRWLRSTPCQVCLDNSRFRVRRGCSSGTCWAKCFLYAKEGLEEFLRQAPRLRSKDQWLGVLSNPEKELGFNGFIYRPSRVDYLSNRTFRGLELPVPPNEERKLFSRALF